VFGALVFVVLIGSACGPNKIVSTWTSPTARNLDFRGQKVAAFVMTLQTAMRQGAEASLANELTKRGIVGIPGNSLVPEEVTKDREKVKQILRDAGVKGVVVLRPVSRDTKYQDTPGYWQAQPYYDSFYGYWGTGWTAIYTPGPTNLDVVLTVETLLYSLDRDKDELIWAGATKTTNPKDVSSFMRDLVTSVGAEIKKSGLVKK